MKKIIAFLLGVLILFVWIMPVSNQLNTLNPGMIQLCYSVNIIVLLLVFIFEKRLLKKQLLFSASILGLLLICTLLTMLVNSDNPRISYGYLFNYLPFSILICISPKKIARYDFWDKLFDIICFLLIGVGVLIVIKDASIGQFLKTYYANHYEWLYPGMLEARKTVTFFAAHNMACYYYFSLWLLADYRFSIKKRKTDIAIMLGMVFLIIMCQSTSALLCCGIISVVYFKRWLDHTNRNAIVYLSGYFIAVIVICILNIDYIQLILGSNVNGLAGRFGKSGNLIPTLKYMLFQLPLGICDLNGLWLTDGGWFINLIRGGPVLVLIYYFAFYRFLKLNISTKRYRYILFFSYLLFEVGYQVTMAMRSFMLIIFVVIYFRHLEEKQNGVAVSTVKSA